MKTPLSNNNLDDKKKGENQNNQIESITGNEQNVDIQPTQNPLSKKKEKEISKSVKGILRQDKSMDDKIEEMVQILN